MRKNFWDRAGMWPPVAVRLMARTSGRHPKAMSNEELAQRSGLSVDVIVALMWRDSWDGVPLSTMRRYLNACQMDFENAEHMRRADQYARKRLLKKLNYLRRDSNWSTLWQPLVDLWHSAIKRASNR